MDGSTDQSNADSILLLVRLCDRNGDDDKMHTRMSFVCVHQPQDVTAEGMFQSLQYGLQCLGIESVNKRQVVSWWEFPLTEQQQIWLVVV